MLSLSQVLLDLYDSEINFDIHSFWDAGVEVSILGIDGCVLGVDTFDKEQMFYIGEFLVRESIKHFPTSKIALKHKG